MSDELPEGWAETDLKALTVHLASVRPESEPRREFGYVDISAIDRSTHTINPLDLRRFAGAKAPSRARRPILPGDVLFSNVRTNLRNVALVQPDLPAQLCSTGFTVLRANGAVVPEYLLRWVLTDAFTRTISETQTGTHYPATSDAQVTEQPIRIAPLAEQRRIVEKVEALLEQVNRAKARLERVPLILKRFRQAVLAAACSGDLTRDWRDRHPDAVAPSLPAPTPEARRGRRGANLSGEGLLIDDELPELPNTWIYVRIDRLTEPSTVITYGIVLPGPEVPGGLPYVRGQDVEDGVLRTDALRHTTKEIAAKHPRSSLRVGDVLLCIIRNLRVAVVPNGLDGANITQGMVRIRTSPTVVVRDFVASYLTSPLAQGWMKRRYFGMDMPRINVEDTRAIPVALPPLDEQAEIVRQVQKLFALANTIEARVQAATARADKLPQAVLSKAFAGELVPTEADLARAEGRTYESASELLARVVGNKPTAPSRQKKRSPTKTAPRTSSRSA